MPSDFNGYVESYYAESIQDVQNINGENGVSSHTKLIPNIDRPFLEQIWKWISGNSEIRVGNHVGHMHLTFSEVEERNTAIQRLQQEYAVSPDTENGDAGPAFQGSHEPVDNCLGQAALIAETIVSAGEEATEQSGYAIFKTTDATNPIGLPQEPNSSAANNGNDHGANVKETSEASGTPARITAASAKPEPDHTIRLYTSTSRMWHALTGHGLDFVKVKPLDFDCLSIIARFGSQGILQHDLTRLAGQDKRSLPSRTDRLYEGGYIIKEHLAVKEGIPPKMLHTSRCVLKRFAYLETDPTLQPYPTQVDASSAKKKKKGSRVKGRKNQKAAQSDPPATNDSVVSEPRPVPQWTADRSISNQIFYLVNQSGIKGMSMSVSFAVISRLGLPKNPSSTHTDFLERISEIICLAQT